MTSLYLDASFSVFDYFLNVVNHIFTGVNKIK